MRGVAVNRSPVSGGVLGVVPGLVQVAGVHDFAEADLLARLGVDAIGLPLRLDVNAEDLSEAEAASLVAELKTRRPKVAAVLITYETDPSPLLALLDRIKPDWLQIHAECDPALFQTVRDARPALGLIKSLVVDAAPAVLAERIARFEPHVDAFIVDAHNPHTGARGATGLTVDWALCRDLFADRTKPVILAGGLAPDNVERAVLAAKPDAVDAHTRLEDARGQKDPVLVADFVRRARKALSALEKSAGIG